MKRKLIIGAAIFVAVILITVGVLALFPAISLGHELTRAVINVDESLELHFEGYSIKLIAWDSDELEVHKSQFHRTHSNESVEIVADGNLISVTSEDAPTDSFVNWIGTSNYQSQLWLSLMQFDKYYEYNHEVWDNNYVDFFIYVPKNISINTYSRGVMDTSNDVDFTAN